MKKHIPRHNSIGEKIRTARKKQGITLEELAKGICSLGKMSNIENGHIAVTEEELEKFCEKLNIPINHFSDPDISEKVQELDFFKQKIRDLIGLNRLNFVESELLKFKEKIDVYQIQSREIDYYFLSGIFYMKTNQYDQSIDYLHKVIHVEENNNYNLKLKLRSYNAISSMLFNQKNVLQCIQNLNQALELSRISPTITKEERDNIYFNRAILYLYIGEMYQALKNINNVKHHLIYPIETEYVKLLITFLEDGPMEDVRKKLLTLREKLQQTNNHEGILRGWALTIYSSMISKSHISGKWKDSLLSDLTFISEMLDFKEKSLAFLQFATFVGLANLEDQRFSEELLSKTQSMLAQVKDERLIARNYYLEGKLANQYKQDESLSLTLFQKALESLNENNNELLKADILFEISKLKKIENEAMDALKLYHGHLQSQFLFTHFHDLTLPDFKF